ncbi:MAG: NACHT domain-containing protein [Moorea sp. SIO2I5]|nr:NACHT domain-containing protein [Moorena sp. SIO2I5]
MKKILILAANPRQDLDLRREIHILKGVIERSQAQDDFDVKIGSGVSSAEIQRLFLEHQPRIVHFCGHGAGEEGLVFEDDENSEKLVTNEALSDLFKHFYTQVECVLLNACYSNIQATAISHYINYVIGMKQAIRDDAAIVFARGFYQTLGYKQSIQDAYDLGCNAIKIQIDNLDDYSSKISESERKFINRKLVFQRLPEYLKPQLKIKSPLTRFPNQKKINYDTQNLRNLIELVKDEVNRNKYKKDIKNYFNLGTNNVNRGQPLTQQEYRWRKVLLSKVKDYWIKGVLEKSLFSQVLFEQEITNRSDAVERPFSGLEEFSVESDKSFDFIQASDIFEGMGAGGTLLILGEPGTGKTLSLLKLAERLIKRTEKELSLPIPVVFTLSSWAIKRQSIADWLVEELKNKYQVSKALGKRWIKQEELILLLDGLDEVKAEYRNDCVRALNKFVDTHGITEMVVCCRVQDYQALSARLKLRNAICIQPLSSEYIYWYLEDVGKPLLGLKQLLQTDKELEKFAKTPLIFSVMSIAYQGYSLEALLEEMSVKEKRYQRLFDNYIERMFTRKQISLSKKYKKKLTIHYLIWLSKSLKKESQSMFLIEQMQPNCLKTNAEITFYRTTSGFIAGFIAWFIFGLFFGITIWFDDLYKALINQDISFLFEVYETLIVALMFSFPIFLFETFIVFFMPKIKPIDNLKWSNSEFRKSILKGLIIGTILSLVFGLFFWGILALLFAPILEELIELLILGLIIGIISGLSYPIIQGLKGLGIESKKIRPNQGIIKSAFNALILATIAVIVGVVIVAVFAYILIPKLIDIDLATYFIISLSAVFALIIGLSFGGGNAIIQHFTLRSMLYKKGCIPWNYARFLNYATERLFMQKVGGGYIFIHRMLMDHFANMKLD